MGPPLGNRAVTFFSPFFILKPQGILPPSDGASAPYVVWEGYGICPCGQLRGNRLQGGHWRGVQACIFCQGYLVWEWELAFFPLAGQIPIISLLGASLKHSSQTAPLQAFFPESTSESTVPKLRARGHSLGSTRCPFGTVVFLRSSSRVLGAASPEKQSCLKNFTLLS